MMDRKDNYMAVRASIAKRILNSSLAGCIGYPNDEHRLHGLTQVAEATDASTVSSWFWMSPTFRRSGTDCTLDIRCDEVSNYRGCETDKDGNEWTQYTFNCTVNHPCHGAAPVAHVLSRASFYQQVAMLGIEIEAEFGGTNIWRMTRTAEEIKEAEAKRAAEKLSTALKAFVTKWTKDARLRVNGKPVEVLSFEAEAVGIHVDANGVRCQHEVLINDRRYLVRTDLHRTCIFRTL